MTSPVEETTKILHGLRERYEEFHGVTLHRRGVDAAAVLAARYLHDRQLPDKAIDLLDEAGAAVRPARHASRRRGRPCADLEEVLATMAQIPPRQVDGQRQGAARRRWKRDLEAARLRAGRRDRAARRRIKLSRAGLRDPQKPIGTFLFTGPTGVGKTEVAKQLAEVLGIALPALRHERVHGAHTVSRLIGAPPGYVGFDRGGLLTEAIAKTPHAVLLLDEIEKAHPDVFNVLLQVMDHGTLTDNNGKQTDFRHVILLMTSNVGARGARARRRRRLRRAARHRARRRRRGAQAPLQPRVPQPARRAHRASTRSRPRSWSSIVDKFMRELAGQLAEKNVKIELTEPARKLLAEKGYDPAFGARPLGRVIQETIKRPLGDELLFGASRTAARRRWMWRVGRSRCGTRRRREPRKRRPRRRGILASPLRGAGKTAQCCPRAAPRRPFAKLTGRLERSCL